MLLAAVIQPSALRVSCCTAIARVLASPSCARDMHFLRCRPCCSAAAGGRGPNKRRGLRSAAEQAAAISQLPHFLLLLWGGLRLNAHPCCVPGAAAPLAPAGSAGPSRLLPSPETFASCDQLLNAADWRAGMRAERGRVPLAAAGALRGPITVSAAAGAPDAGTRCGGGGAAGGTLRRAQSADAAAGGSVPVQQRRAIKRRVTPGGGPGRQA